MATWGITSPCRWLITSHDLFALQFLWWKMLWNPSIHAYTHPAHSSHITHIQPPCSPHTCTHTHVHKYITHTHRSMHTIHTHNPHTQSTHTHTHIMAWTSNWISQLTDWTKAVDYISYVTKMKPTHCSISQLRTSLTLNKLCKTARGKTLPKSFEFQVWIWRQFLPVTSLEAQPCSRAGRDSGVLVMKYFLVSVSAFNWVWS